MANTDMFNAFSHLGGSKKQLKESVTPHKIALMVMTKEYCSVVGRVRSGREILSKDDAEEYSKKQMRNFALNLLHFIQIPDVELKELANRIKETMTPKFYDAFYEKLKDLHNQSVAGIMEYIQSVEVLMVDPDLPTPVVHKSSVIGLFLRRMLLAFDKMSFSQVTKLYRNFKSYFEAAFENPSEHDSSSLELMNFTCDELKPNKSNEDSKLWKGFASHKQSELFIAQQAALIQTNVKEALLPPHLHARVCDLLKTNPDLAEAHYLNYLNCLRVKEYCGAVHHLHHCFDRNTLVNQDTKVSNPDDICRGFRYAALNLAALHCHFGHKSEAIAALREAITIAQDANDNVCLQHALSWLYRLEKERREVLMERSIAKTGDLNLSYLTSLSVQAFTQHKALLTVQPSQVFELMMKSDILNCQHSMLELMANSYAQKAALWHMYGKSSTSNLCSQLLLHLNTSDPARKGLYHSGEGVCLAVCNVAMMLAQEGEINEALRVLGFAKDRFPTHTQYSHIWMLTEEMINFDQALLQENWKKAETAVENIAIADPIESRLRQAHLELYRDDSAKASRLIFMLLDEVGQTDDISPEFHARVLMLQAELHVVTSNYASAIAPLTKASSICQHHHLEYMESIIVLHIANVQLLLELPSQALSLLDQIMVSIFAHGSIYDRSRAYLLYAKCTIAQATSPEDKKTAYLSALKMLSTAMDGFSKIDADHRVKDVLFLQACLYNEMGDLCERNKCALRFRLMDQQMESSFQPRTNLL